MKKLLIPVSLLGALLLAGCSMNGTNNDASITGHSTTVVTGTSDDATDGNNVDNKDANFVSWAMADNEAELDLVRIGKMKLTDSELKAHAGVMETDHGNVGQQLADYASKKGIKLADNDAAHANDTIQDNIDDLADYASGVNFDKAWLEKAIDAHEDAIAEYKKAGSDVKDQELKDWISRTIPSLQSHLDKLRGIQDRMK